MDAPIADEPDEVTLEDDGSEPEVEGVDGRNLSEGTISTLLAASQFDGQGFYLSAHEIPTMKFPANDDVHRYSNQPSTAMNEHNSQAQAGSDSLQDGESLSVSDDALKRAYGEVMSLVRTLKRDRESRPGSRNHSHDETNGTDFFAQPEAEDNMISNSNTAEEESGRDEEGDEFLPPPEEPLKPHLEQIHISVEPDSLGSW
jgi:hypothetical protein